MRYNIESGMTVVDIRPELIDSPGYTPVFSWTRYNGPTDANFRIWHDTSV